VVSTIKSDPDNPTRLMVDVKFERELRRFISLEELKVQPGLVGISPAAQGQQAFRDARDP
jgi:predicted RNA-binding protein with PUA-like domain